MSNRMKKEEQLNQITNLQAREYIEQANNNSQARLSETLGGTGNTYVSAMKIYEEFLRNVKGLNDEEVKNFDCINLNLMDFKNMSDYLIHTKRNCENTHNQRLVTIGGMMSYIVTLYHFDNEDLENKINKLKNIVKQKYFKQVPTVDKPFFKPSDIAKLKRTILDMKDGWKKRRLLAMFYLYRDTGNRCDEVRNFEISDFHFSDIPGRSYVITPATNKVLEEKKHYLKEETVEALKDYIAHRNPKNENEKAIFLSNYRTKISISSIKRLFKDLYAEAGFGYYDEDGKAKSEYGMHTMRHSAITEVNNKKGLAAARIFAGHADIKMTSHYVHQSEEEKMSIALDIFSDDDN